MRAILTAAGIVLSLAPPAWAQFTLSHRTANAEVEIDQSNTRKRRARIWSGRRWVDDGASNYVTSVSRVGGDGEREIRSAATNVRARPDGRFGIFSEDFATLWAITTLTVQRFRSGAWEDLELSRSGVIVGADQWEWRASGVTGLASATLIVAPGRSKWEYAWTPTANGTYRFEVRHAIQATPLAFASYVTRGAGQPYMAAWQFADGSLMFNWSDLHRTGVFGDATVSQSEVVVHTASRVLAASEAWTVDPSFGSDAAWGSEVGDDGNKYPNDGFGDGSGFVGGVIYRVANRFTITTLPTTATVDQVDLQLEINNVGSAVATATWDIGPYNGTGQGDPEADSAATMYTRCNVSADLYVNNSTSFRTTGSKTFTALGATANADVEAARDAGSTFVIAWKADDEGLDNGQSDSDEYTGSDPPTLTITYTEAGGATPKGLMLLGVGP